MDQIARTYARSLFEVASEKGTLDNVHQELAQIDDAIAASDNLRLFFFSPYFSSEEKQKALGSTFEGADPIVINLLSVMAENHRLPAIPQIRKAFDSLWREERKLLEVEITSAIELDPASAQRIGDEIGRRTGRTVELNQSVDPELIGGMTLRVGNQILDASISNRLESLRRQIVAG